MKVKSFKRMRWKQCRLNGCDYWECATCPHEECVADPDVAEYWRERYGEVQKRADRKRVEKCRELGLCSGCHKNKADEGYRTCESCRKKAIDRYHSNHIPKPDTVLPDGICSWCRKKPVIEDRKLCAGCYERAVKQCEVLNTIRRAKNAENITHRPLPQGM